MTSALLSALTFAALALAGALLFDLARSGWGERHPVLREAALLCAFVTGLAMLAAMVTLPARLAWAVVASAPAGVYGEVG